MARENAIVKSVLDYLNSLPECVAEKTYGSAISSGKADINGCYRGRAFRLEIKTSDYGNTASVKQKVNLLRWKNAGAIVGVAYSLEDVKKMLGIGD